MRSDAAVSPAAALLSQLLLPSYSILCVVPLHSTIFSSIHCNTVPLLSHYIVKLVVFLVRFSSSESITDKYSSLV